MALVVFLRGVNVGGHRTFRPAVLARQLTHLDAVSIGAAGTFVIRRPGTQVALRAELVRRLPFETEIMICRGRDIVRLMDEHPFGRQRARAGVVRFVSVLSRRPHTEPSLPVRFPSSGQWLTRILARQDRFVFGMYRRHMKAIGYLGKVDGLFGVPATTRNWNTMTAIARGLSKRDRCNETRNTRLRRHRIVRGAPAGWARGGSDAFRQPGGAYPGGDHRYRAAR